MKKTPTVTPKDELERLVRYSRGNSVYLGKVEGSAEASWGNSGFEVGWSERQYAVNNLYERLESLEATHITKIVSEYIGVGIGPTYRATCEAYKINNASELNLNQ